MHKNTKLFPRERQEIYRRWKSGWEPASLAREFRVSRETIYEIARRGKYGEFENRTSMNQRYRTLEYGLRRLLSSEQVVARKIAAKAHKLKRYEKAIPGEMVHLDTKRLPLLRGEGIRTPREYLFVAIDDHSRWLFADIFPDKTSYSAAIFLEEVRRTVPFPVTGIYSDNGSEYKGKPTHPVVAQCRDNGISQGFTKVKHPWTNGKAERVIRTLMEEWHPKTHNLHQTRDHRRRHLYAFVDWYNQSRYHLTIASTPLERLERFVAGFDAMSVNNA